MVIHQVAQLISDIRDTPPVDANPSKVSTDVRSVVPDYRPSGSLDALQELVDVAA